MVKIFVYGILVGRYDSRQPASLRGFEKVREDSFDSIIPNENTWVGGELIDVEQWQFEDIDNIECYPDYYTRFKVDVEVEGGIERAWVYQQTRHFKPEVEIGTIKD
jgi:gamma-glutamylcyclotransferase (GGCT)/AIG2-like uncharacterized protein YtfP